MLLLYFRGFKFSFKFSVEYGIEKLFSFCGIGGWGEGGWTVGKVDGCVDEWLVGWVNEVFMIFRLRVF